ncbi:MAG: hypothetical protein KAV87_09695 [Desulfobacteraceae bacterium]|nr:hypothetical protein [Desulfobacteraceae bacterium]
MTLGFLIAWATGNLDSYYGEEKFEFYTEPFDITEPPTPPPNVTIREGFGETKKSKKRSAEWEKRLEEYGRNLDTQSREKSFAKRLDKIIKGHQIEGRCVKCHKRLMLTITRTDSRQKIIVTVAKCEKHPEHSLILWPQSGVRPDIKGA